MEMRIFHNRGKVWILTNCRELDSTTVIGTILGNGGNKIFSIYQEVDFVDRSELPVKNKDGSYTYNMKWINL